MTLVTISRAAEKVGGTTADLKEGDILTLEQLFYAMMLPSGNDAAFTLGEYFGQLIKDQKYNFKHNDQILGKVYLSPFREHPTMKYFLKEMNKHAEQLGMLDTFFDSPHGLKNDRNYSTAYDVCLMCQECMKLPIFKTVVAA